MKNTVLVGVLCLAIGIAVGWFAKPKYDRVKAVVAIPGDAPKPAKPTAITPGSATSTKAGDRPERSGQTAKADEKRQMFDFIDEGKFKASQDRWHQTMLDQTKQRTNRKVAELAKKLGLDANQEAQLQAWFDREIEKLAGDKNNMHMLGKLLRQESVDQALADILTDDQAVAYEEMKTNERNRKVESRALKDLAKINTVLDLTQEQKDAVYNLLYEDAGEKVDTTGNNPAAMAFSINGQDIDLDDLGIGGLTDLATVQVESDGQDGKPADKVDWKQLMKEQNQRRIDAKVDRLAPVLTEEQTTQYREHLEARNQGGIGGAIIGGAVGGAVMGDVQVETRVLEINPGESE